MNGPVPETATLNVTLLFTQRQYEIARDAIWRGAQKRKSLDGFKSVYSIFVSRIDVYTKKAVPDLIPAAQGLVGIVNAQTPAPVVDDEIGKAVKAYFDDGAVNRIMHMHDKSELRPQRTQFIDAGLRAATEPEAVSLMQPAHA